jgi:transcriptional regulator with XRE-family HTH domain
MKFIFIPEYSNEGDQAEKQSAFNMISDNFLEIVNDHLKIKKLSKSWLAGKLKVSAPAVSKLLAKNTNPTLKTIADVANALNIIIELKFTDKDNFLKKIEDEIYGKKASKKIIVNPKQTKEF